MTLQILTYEVESGKKQLDVLHDLYTSLEVDKQALIAKTSKKCVDGHIFLPMLFNSRSN